VIVSDPEHQLSAVIRQLATTLAGEMVGALGVESNQQSEAEAKSRRSRRRK
jgi:hypothetical protein